MEVFVIDSNVDRINKKPVADKNGNTLGDIDVLIIDNEMHHIYVAEVKDFNFLEILMKFSWSIRKCLLMVKRNAMQQSMLEE